MGKILVTGASGHIGRLTLLNLLERKVPANQLVALVRDPEKAQDLQSLGIELRKADYMDPQSLLQAFEGIEKLMLVSSQAFSDRKKAHSNVIAAAVESRIKHIVFMPIIRKEGSSLSLKEVTDEDIFTEEKIIASGLNYTFVRHPPFLNTLASFFDADIIKSGIYAPGGDGKVAAATREDLAEAHGAVLTQTGHENKSYILSGDSAFTLIEMTEIISKAAKQKVPFVSISEESYLARKTAAGAPDFVAHFLLDWLRGINQGEWDNVTGDLTKLIGHKPTTAQEYFGRLYTNPS
jgi:NAD(P)H dehydrogenase (quinone)